MTCWRVVTREIAKGPTTLRRLQFLGFDPTQALKRAREFGLIESVKVTKYSQQWQITQRGLDWIAGRIVVEPATTRRGRRPDKPHATWLMSLPQGIRLESSNEAP